MAGYRGDSIRAQAIVQMSEVLETSRHKETTSEHSHQWLDENGWIIRTAYLQDRKGNIYEATLNIPDGRNGKILYELNRVHKIDTTKNLGKHTDTGEGQRSRYQEPGPGGTQSEVEDTGGVVSSTENGRNSRESGNFENSVTENDSYVKQKFSFDDEDYMLAVEAGDMEAAQKMVDEAAKAAMPNTKILDDDGNLLMVYHGSDAKFTEFDMSKGRSNMNIQGAFFSPWELDAQGYGETVGRFYLNITNPASESVVYKALNMFKGQNDAGIKAQRHLERLGYDGVNNGNEEYIAFYPEQAKSADPVTYDDNGKIIPISERFDTGSRDIRYSFEEDVEATDEEYRQVMDSEPVQHRTAEDLKREIRDTIERGNRQEKAPESTATVTRKVPAGEFYPEGTTVTHTYGRGKPFYSKTTNLSPEAASQKILCKQL